jgi:hypothetical protein
MLHLEYQQRRSIPKSNPLNLFLTANNFNTNNNNNTMDTFNWSQLSSPMSPEEQMLTPGASVSPAGTPIKVEWPYAVGGVDFSLFDTRETGPTVQTIYPSTGSVGVIQGQLLGLDHADPALGPLERIQRKWGIGDRKTRGECCYVPHFH